MDYNPNRHARGLFDGIVDQYDLLAELFSFGQNRRWRSYLVSRLGLVPGDLVMDLCTGTAGVAMQAVSTSGSRVVGVDLSREMLHRARLKTRKAAMDENIALFMGRAESLPFPNGCFDKVCFTYLLRYVEDPKATLTEIVRVVKPGGRLASLEFGIPVNIMVKSLWYVYTRAVLPLTAGVVSPGWREVGKFLGPSISRFYQSYTLEDIQQMWINLGIPDVRVRRQSLGGAVVMWGTKADSHLRPPPR